MKRKNVFAAVITAIAVLTAYLCSMCVFAEDIPQNSGAAGNFSWKIENGTLFISGHGDMPDYGPVTPPWDDLHDTITAVIVEEGITRIGSNSFSGFANLADVKLPESLKSIGSMAFSSCSSLSDITIPDGCSDIGGAFAYSGLKSIKLPKSLTEIGGATFRECVKLESIVIPENVTSIGTMAFMGDNSLKSIVIPESVKKVGTAAFCSCPKLSDISFPDGLEYVGMSGFYDTKWYRDHADGMIYIGKVAYNWKGDMPENTVIDIKPGTVSVSYGCFSGCENLVGVTIPEGVVDIGWDAFSGCKNLKSIILPKTVEFIGPWAFKNCTGLSEVILSENLKELYYGVFAGCTSLTGITLPGGVTSIPPYTFDGCTNLSDIRTGGNIESVGNDAFKDTAWYNSQPDGVVYFDRAAYGWKGDMPENTFVTIKPGTVSLSPYCFGSEAGEDRYDNLVGISLPDGLKIIGENAFTRCGNLRSVTVPDGVGEIENFTFAYCFGLESVTIPNSVEKISSYAFYYCNSLKGINFKGAEAEWEKIGVEFAEEEPPKTLAVHFVGQNSSSAAEEMIASHRSETEKVINGIVGVLLRMMTSDKK